MGASLEDLRQTIPLGEMTIPLEHYLDRLALTVEDMKVKRILDIGSGISRNFANVVY